jgi:hypothetical protein
MYYKNLNSVSKTKIRKVEHIRKHTGVHRPLSETHCLLKVVFRGNLAYFGRTLLRLSYINIIKIPISKVEWFQR